jgi:outer membrane receptor for ferrienterochelin and colicins
MRIIPLLSILYILLLLCASNLYGQTKITGKVATQLHEPLVGATIQILGTTTGTVTDVSGLFSLKVEPGDKLVISYVGYRTDTLTLGNNTNLHIMLHDDSEQMESVIIKSESTMIDKLEPRQSVVILESELLKAACCNLSESFETNASVDVSFSDAITGAKVIRMLGLDGRYVQINRENIPLVRGLSSRYGLGYVPGTWLQSIDVGKGAGSVVNGYESMTGQINLEFKKPEINEKLYLNAYANEFGKVEFNYNQSFKLNDKWSTGVLSHVDYMSNEVDRNDDGFLDLPMSRQVNVLNRYKYDTERIKSQIGIQVMSDEKVAGQLGFGFNDNALTSSLYGYSNNTNRFEIYGKTGLIFPNEPYKGWGFIYSLSYQDIDATFGRRPYQGSELTGYGNVIYQNIIGNSFHQYRTGVSFLFDQFDERFNFLNRERTELVPGAYFEYTYLPSDRFTAVIGNRLDYHNQFGWFYTPRIHARFQLADNTTMRISGGSGRRTPNPIAENVNFLVSSKSFTIEEELNQEVSWSIGSSLVHGLTIADKSITLLADYNYTFFTNQMVVDLHQNQFGISIYNLDGQSYAHSMQIEAQASLSKLVDIKAAYKRQDVYVTMSDYLHRAPYVPKDRILLNIAYATKYDKWKADLTANYIGIKPLPNPEGHIIGNVEEIYSPYFWLINGQISRGFRWGSVYLGGENLLNFKQANPIVSSDDPFSVDFNASNIWGPVAGRLIYTGVRFKIK